MIAAYKILSGKDKVDPEKKFSFGGGGTGPRTRQAACTHDIRKQSSQPQTDIRRHSFSSGDGENTNFKFL